MKKNLFLLIATIIIGVIFEFFAEIQIKKLLKRNGYTNELIEFYDQYHKELHHLGD